MKQKIRNKRKLLTPKTVLQLPDLELSFRQNVAKCKATSRSLCFASRIGLAGRRALRAAKSGNSIG
jgi:hypothetical protein